MLSTVKSPCNRFVHLPHSVHTPLLGRGERRGVGCHTASSKLERPTLGFVDICIKWKAKPFLLGCMVINGTITQQRYRSSSGCRHWGGSINTLGLTHFVLLLACHVPARLWFGTVTVQPFSYRALGPFTCEREVGFFLLESKQQRFRKVPPIHKVSREQHLPPQWRSDQCW